MKKIKKLLLCKEVVYVTAVIGTTYFLFWLNWVLSWLNHGIKIGFDVETSGGYFYWWWQFTMNNGILSLIGLISIVYTLWYSYNYEK